MKQLSEHEFKKKPVIIEHVDFSENNECILYSNTNNYKLDTKNCT